MYRDERIYKEGARKHATGAGSSRSKQLGAGFASRIVAGMGSTDQHMHVCIYHLFINTFPPTHAQPQLDVPARNRWWQSAWLRLRTWLSTEEPRAKAPYCWAAGFRNEKRGGEGEEGREK